MALDDLDLVGIMPLHFAGCALVVVAVLAVVYRVAKSRKSSWSTRKSPDENHPWVLQFPPSRRHTLADLKLKGSAGPYLVPAPDILRRQAVPSTRAADWDEDHLFTPTGFSTEDIRALGRFPDYSVLTGVRDPEPYGPHFDIHKAIFRPFRPFRWSYHQTMGKYPNGCSNACQSAKVLDHQLTIGHSILQV